MQRKMIQNNTMQLLNQDWFQALIQEIREAYWETEHIATVEFLRGKWLTGRLIENNKENFKGVKVDNQRITEVIANSLAGITERQIYHCWKFYRDHPGDDFDTVCQTLPGDGKTPHSWRKQIADHEHHKCIFEKVEAFACKICGRLRKNP